SGAAGRGAGPPLWPNVAPAPGPPAGSGSGPSAVLYPAPEFCPPPGVYGRRGNHRRPAVPLAAPVAGAGSVPAAAPASYSLVAIDAGPPRAPGDPARDP